MSADQNAPTPTQSTPPTSPITTPTPSITPAPAPTPSPAPGALSPTPTPVTPKPPVQPTAAAGGTPTPTPVTPAATVTNPSLVAVNPVSTQPSNTTANPGKTKTPTEVVAIINSLLSKTDSEAKAILENIYQYIENMMPGKAITPQTGARHQLALFRTLQNLFNNVDTDFEKVYAAVLKLVEAHKSGVFAPTHAFRFINDMPLDAKNKQAFQRMMDLVTLTAPVKGRDTVMKQVDLSKSTEHGLTERGRQKIHQFYSVFTR